MDAMAIEGMLARVEGGGGDAAHPYNEASFGDQRCYNVIVRVLLHFREGCQVRLVHLFSRNTFEEHRFVVGQRLQKRIR